MYLHVPRLYVTDKVIGGLILGVLYMNINAVFIISTHMCHVCVYLYYPLLLTREGVLYVIYNVESQCVVMDLSICCVCACVCVLQGNVHGC